MVEIPLFFVFFWPCRNNATAIIDDPNEGVFLRTFQSACWTSKFISTSNDLNTYKTHLPP